MYKQKYKNDYLFKWGSWLHLRSNLLVQLQISMKINRGWGERKHLPYMGLFHKKFKYKVQISHLFVFVCVGSIYFIKETVNSLFTYISANTEVFYSNTQPRMYNLKTHQRRFIWWQRRTEWKVKVTITKRWWNRNTRWSNRCQSRKWRWQWRWLSRWGMGAFYWWQCRATGRWTFTWAICT